MLYGKNCSLYWVLFLNWSLAIYEVTHASCYFTWRINLIGLPPQTCMLGTTLPGGTTLLAVMMAPSSTIAPSRTTEFWPMYAFSFKRHEYKVHPLLTTTSSWISREAVSPFVVEAAVCNTQLFPIKTLVWMLGYEK